MKELPHTFLCLILMLTFAVSSRGESESWVEPCRAVLQEARKQWNPGMPPEFDKYFELVVALGKSVTAEEAQRLQVIKDKTLEQCVALASWEVQRDPIPLKLLSGWLARQEYEVKDDLIKMIHAEMRERGYSEKDLPHPVRQPVPTRKRSVVEDSTTRKLPLFAEKDFRAAWEIYSLHFSSVGNVGYLDRIGGEESFPVCLEALTLLKERSASLGYQRTNGALTDLARYFRTLSGEKAFAAEMTCIEIQSGVYSSSSRKRFRNRLLYEYCRPDPALKVQHWVRIRPSLIVLLKRSDLEPGLRADLEALRAALPADNVVPEKNQPPR